MAFFKRAAGLQGQAVAQPVDLFQRNLPQFIRGIRPVEGVPVQPFHQDPKSGAIPLENLDQCASAIAEREHTAGVRVEVEFQFDDRGQAGIALAKVRNPARQIDRCASGKIKHGPSKPEGALP